MRNRCVLICSVLLVLLTTSFVGNAREVEPLTMRDSVNSGPGRVFQLAFTSRAETQFPNDQGFIELRGYAEDLSAPHPGDVLGQFDEDIGRFCTEPPADLPPCPIPEACTPICDTIYTNSGSVTYQAWVLVMPVTPAGPFLTSAIWGEIVGGTKSYRGARGTAELAGRISLCDTPGDGLGCAESFQTPPELGVRFDCNFILKGRRY